VAYKWGKKLKQPVRYEKLKNGRGSVGCGRKGWWGCGWPASGSASGWSQGKRACQWASWWVVTGQKGLPVGLPVGGHRAKGPAKPPQYGENDEVTVRSEN